MGKNMICVKYVLEVWIIELNFKELKHIISYENIEFNVLTSLN